MSSISSDSRSEKGRACIHGRILVQSALRILCCPGTQLLAAYAIQAAKKGCWSTTLESKTSDSSSTAGNNGKSSSANLVLRIKKRTEDVLIVLTGSRTPQHFSSRDEAQKSPRTWSARARMRFWRFDFLISPYTLVHGQKKYCRW